MKLTSILLLAFSVLAMPASCGTAQVEPGQLAQQSAETWLALIDSGKYAESWQDAAQLFKSHVTEDQWQSAMTATRLPFGKLKSRKVKTTTLAKSLPGAPDGQYVVIQYDSSFEHKQLAVETVTPMLDKNGQWKVSGYYIK
jgi:hypothetical protein